jgi:hypothetical protein
VALAAFISYTAPSASSYRRCRLKYMLMLSRITEYSDLHCTTATVTATAAATHSVAVVMMQTKRAAQYIAVMRGTYYSVN